MWLSRKHSEKLLPGDIFLVYLIVYPFGRFLLEFLRLDPAMVGGININQTIMLVVGMLATATLIWRHARRRPTAEAKRCLTHIIDSRTAFSLAGCP